MAHPPFYGGWAVIISLQPVFPFISSTIYRLLINAVSISDGVFSRYLKKILEYWDAIRL
jgi:hypothetical protein